MNERSSAVVVVVVSSEDRSPLVPHIKRSESRQNVPEESRLRLTAEGKERREGSGCEKIILEGNR